MYCQKIYYNGMVVYKWHQYAILNMPPTMTAFQGLPHAYMQRGNQGIRL